MRAPDDILKYSSWKSGWDDPSAFDVLDYISFKVHPDDVLILGHLFFPKFVEVSNCIFFEETYKYDVYKERINRALSQQDCDKKALEKSFNLIHIYDLFAHLSTHAPERVKDAVFEDVGKLLQLAWSIHLKHIFPDKSIVVEYYHSDQEYGPIVTIYQE